MTDTEKPIVINIAELLAETAVMSSAAGTIQTWLVCIVAPVNGFSLPADPREICHLTRWKWRRFARHWPDIEPFWPLGPDGRRYHYRLLGWQRDHADGHELREHVH